MIARDTDPGRVTLAHEVLGEHPATLWGDAWWEAQK